MSLVSIDFNSFKEEIELIQSQNPVECELYSIIASVIRGGKHRNDISLRDFSARRRSEISEPFYGEGGFPDFVVLKRDKNRNIQFGAIEVKRIALELDDYLEQLHKHISSFKKVIYTNGLIWRYYELEKNNPIRRWEITLGKRKNSIIEWEKSDKWDELKKNLDKIDWVIPK